MLESGRILASAHALSLSRTRCRRDGASCPPMSLYAIGDIQGCHAEFCQLLEMIGFSARADRLWLVGDLVNRGPGSLAVLREVKALGAAAVTVLGNHDFHLLTVAAGHAARTATRHHRADPRRTRPRRAARLGAVVGRWSSSRATACSCTRACCRNGRRRRRWRCRARCRQRSPATITTRSCARSTATTPRAWRDDLAGFDRLRVVVNACTRMRFCTAEGTMEFEREARARGMRRPASGRGSRTRRRASAGTTIVCGHWSTRELMLAPNLLMLDSGCLWGGSLTGGQARRSPRLPGAGTPAGDAKAVRIASSAARDSSRRWRARAGSGGIDVQLDDDPALAGHAPERRQEARLADVGRRVAVPVARRAIADRDRLDVTLGVDDRLQQRAVERQQRRCRRSSCPRERSRPRRRVRARRPRCAIDRCACRAAASRSMNSVPDAGDQPPDDRPAPQLGLGDEPRRLQRVQHEDVEPRNVVGDDQQVAGQSAIGEPVHARLDRSMRSRRATSGGSGLPARRAREPGKDEHRRRQALGDVHGAARAARDARGNRAGRRRAPRARRPLSTRAQALRPPRRAPFPAIRAGQPPHHVAHHRSASNVS